MDPNSQNSNANNTDPNGGAFPQIPNGAPQGFQQPATPQQPVMFGPAHSDVMSQPFNQPVGSTKVFGKKLGKNYKILIALISLVFLAISIVGFFALKSKTTFGDLETATLETLSFKKPVNWKVSKTSKGKVSYTPGGAETKDSYTGMNVVYERFEALQSATQQQKTDFVKTFKSSFASEKAASMLISTGCTKPQIESPKDNLKYPGTLAVISFNVTCPSNDKKTDAKKYSSFLLLTEKGSAVSIDLTAPVSIYAKNEAKINEILGSITDK